MRSVVKTFSAHFLKTGTKYDALNTSRLTENHKLKEENETIKTQYILSSRSILTFYISVIYHEMNFFFKHQQKNNFLRKKTKQF